MSQLVEAIKTVFFDFDGVLTTDRSGSQTTIRSLSQSTDIAEQRVHYALAPHIGSLVLGHKTHEQIWPQFCKMLGCEINRSVLTKAFESTPLNQPMLSIAKELGARYRVGMITDNPSDRMNHITQVHGLGKLFDPILVSADMGSSKHTPDIFQRALDLTCTAPSEAIFIDNTERNLLVARQLGMHVVHHDDADNNVDRLRYVLSTEYGLALAGAA